MVLNVYLGGNFLNFNLTEIWFYFTSHLVFSMLFAVHYILFRISKYTNDKFNRILKNSKSVENFRTTVNTPKSIFNLNHSTNKRFYIYVSSCLKY